MDKNITVANLTARKLVGYVHPEGIAWLSKNQNTGSSIQLLGAPKEDINVAVYADVVRSADTTPVVDVSKVDLDPADLRLETWRKNRGGWDTRPDNCCRLTHVPSGITVTVEGDDDARSVHAAKAQAMEKLKVELARRAAAPGAMDQAGLADRVAAVLAAHGISVRPSICAAVANEVVAGMGPVLTKDAFERLVSPWDHVSCTDNFVSDIGGSLRDKFNELATQASPKCVRDREAERKALGNDAFHGWLDTKLYNSERTVWDALVEMTLTQAAWSGWLYRNMHGTAPELTAAAEALADNLAALVRKLVFALRKASPDHPDAERALSYLKRKGLVGSPLRLADVPTRPSKAEDFKNRLHGALNMSHHACVPELQAPLQRLTHALSGSEEHALSNEEFRAGLQEAVGLAQAAANPELLAKLTGLQLDFDALNEPVQGDCETRDVLQDAANLAHAYGRPELYTKLKRLMSALSVRLSPETVSEIAATAAKEILPLYIGHFTEQALQRKLEDVVSAAIDRAAGLYGDQRHTHALEEVAHLHTIVNAVALRLREAKLSTLAEKLEDCAASVELVLRAPVVAPAQG